jgi:rifampicin phosphotransferase
MVNSRWGKVAKNVAKAASGIGYTAASLSVLALSSTPSYAIPSPDLVVGSISSISQLIALASAMIGGGAVVVGVRAGANGAGSGRAARIAWRVAIAATVLVCVSLAGNYYQYAKQRSDRQTRLEAAILRPTVVTDGRTLDPDLKETSYGEQARSPHGISTDQMATLLDEKRRGVDANDVVLDVREPAETATGMFPNATPVRFPDFLKKPFSLAGKRAILYCDNGNRSFETCQKLAALGIDCRFMVGGLQKWLAEHRPFAGKQKTSLADFRALPRYPNRDALLDTPDVHKLVAQGAVFVDVRYSGEFSAYHLPGAIDLPVRPTPTAELSTRIAALPHRPIVAPCYDTRSCFYAQVLGYLVSQAGHDFRGRYTVPWEYFVPDPPRPYLLSYLHQLHETWWGRLVDLLTAVLNKSATAIGFLPVVILLAIASRLSVLPFSLKADRDQIVSRRLTDDVDELKRRLCGDPRRMARAMRAFYARHGLTPLRNLLGLLFLPVISVCVASVHAVAVERHQPMLWAANSAGHDATFILPLLFASLICVYLDAAFVRTRRHRLLIWPIGMAILTATGALLSFAVDVYLVVSACLLLVQRAAVTTTVADIRRWWWRRRLSDGVVVLDDAKFLSGSGNKAYRLAIMRSHGFTVPEGVVLTTHFLDKFAIASALWRARELDRLWRQIGASKLVVRSSGSSEDGSANSFAGVFESVIEVDRARLESAVFDVLLSFRNARVAAYGADNGQANIVIQRMIEPDYAGVLFTRDLGCPSHSLVECVAGTADKLVSGTVTPIVCRFGRISLEPIGGHEAPIDMKPLVATGRELEKLFGGPQDVEWAHSGGVFYLVQSRDITRFDAGAESDTAVQNEWSRVLDCAAAAPPDEIIFEQNELSEVLPRPTPLSLSLMDGLWASGGSIDLACRQLGFGYRIEEDAAPYLMTIFGRLYVNKQQEISRAPKLGSLAVWRMGRIADNIESDFNDTFLPAFSKEMAVQEAIDFNKLPTLDLLDAVGRIRANYMGATCVAASVINIAADYYLRRAREKLNAAGIEPARFLTRADRTEFECVLVAAKAAPVGSREQVLLRGVGHRSSVDYELAAPRYAERPADADPLLNVPDLPARGLGEIGADLAAQTSDAALRQAVLVACSFQTLKEDAKHHSLRELAVLRRALLAVDRRFMLDGLVFYLTFEELEMLRDESAVAGLRAAALARRQLTAGLAEVSSVDSTLTVRQIEDYAMGIKPQTADGTDRMGGLRVSGSGRLEGRACVVKEVDAGATSIIPNFQEGDIVVSRMVPPAWLPYFKRAGGFVCEVGGWLSHTAIVAREFNVPLIVQAKGLRTIETGDLIRLDSDGAIEIVAQRQAVEAA